MFVVFLASLCHLNSVLINLFHKQITYHKKFRTFEPLNVNTEESI